MKTNIAIVGAGLAGLALADRLEREGVDCLLLEARERIGGRILTRQAAASHVDLGPSWYWQGQPRIAQLVERFGLSPFWQHDDGAIIAEDASGQMHRGAGFASMGGSLRLAGGMARLVQGLSDSIRRERLLLGTAVAKVSLDDDQVVLGLSGQTTSVHARQVVLAVPPRVVLGTMDFSPALPDGVRRHLLHTPTWMAGQAKLVAVYEAPFWRSQGLSGDAISRRGPLGEIHDASGTDGGSGALFGFVGWSPAERKRRSGDIVPAAIAQLTQLFGPAASSPKEVLLQDWAVEGFTATQADEAPARDHPRYGRPSLFDHLWDDRLDFASTEMARDFGGYLEGALEAAEAAATRLLAQRQN